MEVVTAAESALRSKRKSIASRSATAPSARRRASFINRVSAEKFRLVSGHDDLGTYQFGTMVAKHHFCKVCGIHVFTRPTAAPDLYIVNVRCLDDFELSKEKVELVEFDGRNWEKSVGQLR